MHILFTRPLEDSCEIILKFQSLGHNVSHLPLISVQGLKHEDLNYSDFALAFGVEDVLSLNSSVNGTIVDQYII